MRLYSSCGLHGDDTEQVSSVGLLVIDVATVKEEVQNN
jgi:hypothetical protein